MTQVFLKVVNMSIAASWLVLAVLVFRFLLKKAPKWVSVLLWGIVAIRLLCPFTIESPWSLIPSGETIAPAIMTQQTPAIESGIPAVNHAVNPIISQTFTPDAGDSANPLQIWLPILSILWGLGTAGLLTYAAISYWSLKRKVSAGVLLRDGVYQSERVPTPFVLGIVKPKIYLPFHLDSRDLDYVIAHEQAHICRKDHWWKSLGFLLLAVYWFNPILWLAYSLLCRDIELACDERVIGKLGRQERADYSQALLTCSAHHRAITACPLAFGEVGVKQRVKNVLNYKKPAFWLIAAAVLSCIILAVCFLTDPEKEKAGGFLTDLEEGNAYPFGGTYQVENISYDLVSFDFAYTPETAPLYHLTAQKTLMVQEDKAAENWQDAGMCTEFKLAKENFDDYFMVDALWNGTDAQSLRRNNQRAWRVVVSDQPFNDIFYYILLQENGELYLTYGYMDQSTASSVYAEAPFIRWIFKLKPCDLSAYPAGDENQLSQPSEVIYPDADETQLARLIDSICASPTESSVPGDYIKAHGEEYDQLVGYGKATLRYCYRAFLLGNQTDLRGHIMALACRDIMEKWGESSPEGGETGQDWFEGFRQYALSLEENGDDLEKSHPGAWILLNILTEDAEIHNAD